MICISGECQTGYEDFKVKTNSSLITSTTTALDCQPINHCLNETSCHANATCQFLGPDQFSCTCHQGYAGNGTHCSRKLVPKFVADFWVFRAVWSNTKRYVLLQNIFCNLIHILYSEDKITFFAPIFWEQQQALTFVHFSTFKTFVLDSMSKQGEGISKGSVNVLCSLLKKHFFMKSNMNCSTLHKNSKPEPTLPPNEFEISHFELRSAR